MNTNMYQHLSQSIIKTNSRQIKGQEGIFY
jgi:hypothetical protein